MAREGGLGKGLSSLIPQKKPNSDNQTKKDDQKNSSNFSYTDFESESSVKDFNSSKEQGGLGDSVKEVSLDEIKANPFQPRKYFNEQKLEELASSIKKHGIIQPLIVSQKPEGGFELIAGERRFKASKLNGLTKVPVIIKKISDKEKMEWALVENVQRHDLNAIEEAEAYKSLIDKFNYTQSQIADQIGKSRSTVANTLRLLELSSEIKKMLKSGEISEGHARSLLAIEDQKMREILAREICGSNLSVRELEKRIKRIKNPKIKNNSYEKDPEIMEVENKISQALGTKVDIKKSKRGGRFVLNYYSDEEFRNLLEKLIS
jgi:ParB family chromosome partitioning protein